MALFAFEGTIWHKHKWGVVCNGVIGCKDRLHELNAGSDPNEAGAEADEEGGKKKRRKKTTTKITKMPANMMDLYRLGDNLDRQQDDCWWGSVDNSDYIPDMIEAVEFLDMPELMTVILTIVGKEISGLAEEKMKCLSRTATPGKLYM